MRTLLTSILSFWLGGSTALFSYYVVWLAINPECHMNWYTTQYFLFWPWYRAIEVIAYCL